MSCGITTEESHELAGELGRHSAARSQPFYYGWVMLPLATLTVIASSPGQTFGISIFNEPMRLSLGLTHAQLAAAYMLGTLLGAIPIIFVGSQMDRLGLRRTLMLAVSLFCLACLFMATVQSWVALTAAFALLRMLGPGALALLSSNTMAFWFERRLGTVEGLRQLGMAAAMTVVPVLSVYLVQAWGWRGAYAIIGIVLWLLLFPAYVFLFRNRPADVGQRFEGGRRLPDSVDDVNLDIRGLTLRETMRTRSFWIASIGSALFGLIHTAVFFCLVPIFAERGLDQAAAAATLTSFAMALAVMQLAGGMLADRYAAPSLLAVGLGGLCLAVLALSSATTMVGGVVAGAALGATQGLYFGTLQPMWARYFGRRHLGKIRGALFTMNVSSSSLGPVLASVIYEVSGSFTPALILFAVLPLPIAILSLFATRPKWESVEERSLLPQPAVEAA